MRARYYSAEHGRFWSPDPQGFAGKSPNLYTYAANRPTLFIDPQGTINLLGLGIGIGVGKLLIVKYSRFLRVSVQGGHGTGKTGNLVVNFFQTGKTQGI